MKKYILLLLLFSVNLIFATYPKEVENLYIIYQSSNDIQEDKNNIENAIKKVENLSGSNIEKLSYENIANTFEAYMDDDKKKNKKEKLKRLKVVIEKQDMYLSVKDSDYLASLGNLMIAAMPYASLPDIIDLGKKSSAVYEASLLINPNHFTTLLSYGVAKAFQPSFAGGGIKESMPILQRALANAKTDYEKYMIYIWISQAYMKQKDNTNYNKYISLASKIYPDGHFLKTVKEINLKNKSIFN